MVRWLLEGFQRASGWRHMGKWLGTWLWMFAPCCDVVRKRCLYG